MIGVSVVDGRPRAPGLAGTVTPDSPWFAAFERLPSGETMTLAGSGTAAPRLSFRDTAGRYCRQVDLEAPGEGVAILACRSVDAWRVEIVSYTGDLTARPGSDYRPAGGGAPPAW